MNYLIIGGDSIVGRHLIRILKKLNRPFIYTSRRRNLHKKNSLFLDLSENLDKWEPPENLKLVFFCAAITSMEFCESNISASRTVNVVNTVKIINKLSKLEIPVIFLSSSQVFDGISSYPNEKASTSPQTEYGYQKREVEKVIQKYKINHSIVRVTKVIHHHYTLFDSWISCLKHGVRIYPFADYYFSPVTVESLVKILILIAESEKGGVWHFSGNKDISYYDAALLIAKSVGADMSLVNRAIGKNKLKNFYFPPSTALRCDRVKSQFGLKQPDVVAIVNEYAQNWKSDNCR